MRNAITTTTTGNIVGLAALAKAIGRAKSTAHDWTNHPLWEWSRRGPWDADDVEPMREWAALHLRPSPAYEDDEDDERDRFYFLRPRVPPLPASVDLDAYPPTSADGLPAPFVSQFELDVLAGRRLLTAEEGADVLNLFLRFRTTITEDIVRCCPGWLVGLDANEIEARLWSAIHVRLDWINGTFERREHAVESTKLKKERR